MRKKNKMPKIPEAFEGTYVELLCSYKEYKLQQYKQNYVIEQMLFVNAVGGKYL